MTLVTDPSILAQLNAPNDTRVTDPDILRQLNSEPSYEPQESKGFGGVATDALGKMLQSIYGIPSGLMALPGEAYGAGKQLLTDRGRVAQNIGAGFGELGHGVLSAPGNIRDYLAKKDLISQESPSFRLPESVLPKEYNYAEALGAKGNQPGDELIRGIPAGVASIPFANKLFSAIEEIPVTKTLAAKPLEQAKGLIKERGISKIPISKDLLKESKKIFKDDPYYKHLLEKAQKGDYNAQFTLQSDLGKKAHALSKSASGAERFSSERVGRLKDRVLEGMKQHLHETGHKDIADLLTKGRNKYRIHMKYKKPINYAASLGLGLMGINPALTKLKQLIP